MTIVDTMISEKKGLNTGEGGARVSIMQFSGKSGINKQSAFNRKDYFSYLGKDRVVDFNFVTKKFKRSSDEKNWYDAKDSKCTRYVSWRGAPLVQKKYVDKSSWNEAEYPKENYCHD